MIACAFVYDVYFRGSFYFNKTFPAELFWRPNTVRGLVGCVFVGHRSATPSYRTRQLRVVALITLYYVLHFIRISFFFIFTTHLLRRYGSDQIRNEVCLRRLSASESILPRTSASRLYTRYPAHRRIFGTPAHPPRGVVILSIFIRRIVEVGAAWNGGSAV